MNLDELSTIQSFGYYNNKNARIHSKAQDDHESYLEFMRDMKIPVHFCD